jgi:hypothetical protein
MEKIIFITACTFLYINVHAQKVGIGISTPKAILQVADSSVVFSATGMALNLQGNPPISGTGRRMMWYADKAAFRAGYSGGTNWDKDNIGNYSFSAGGDTRAKGDYSIAFGQSTTTNGIVSTAFGFSSSAAGDYSTAFGRGTASGINSSAIGYLSVGSGVGSTAIGSLLNANGDYSTAIGYSLDVPAFNDYSTAIGYASSADNSYATAIGANTNVVGSYSTGIGYFSTIADANAVALGSRSTSGGFSQTIGYYSETGSFSSALGGYYSKATGIYSTATGDRVNATGSYSTAFGSLSTASGAYSTAFGYKTNAQSYSTLNIGLYNEPLSVIQTSISPTTALFVVGNGTSDTRRSSVFAVHNNGEVKVGYDSLYTPYSTLMEIKGDMALKQNVITLINGINNNVIVNRFSFVNVDNPTSNFSITGVVAGGNNGKILTILNTSGQNMTISNLNAGSDPQNRINTLSGADIVTVGNGSVTMQYSVAQNRWMVIAVRD